MASSNCRRKTVSPVRGIASPIVCLSLAAPSSDDRTFNGWIDFFCLLPLEAEADATATGG
jgi:hypothetical protein